VGGLSPDVSGEIGLAAGELFARPSVVIDGLRECIEGDIDDDRDRDMYGRGGGFIGSRGEPGGDGSLASSGAKPTTPPKSNSSRGRGGGRSTIASRS
jgi:hypothetical protein